MTKTETFNGHEIGYERRRYGTTTYTWAHIIKPDGYWEVLGDPWPASRFPKAELEHRVEQYKERHAAHYVTDDEIPALVGDIFAAIGFEPITTDPLIRAQQHAADEATLADMICDTCDCDPCACDDEPTWAGEVTGYDNGPTFW